MLQQLPQEITFLWRNTDGHSCPAVGLVRLADEHVVHASQRQALADGDKLRLVGYLEGYGVGVLGKVARAARTCGVDQLRGDGAEGKVPAHDAVVIGRLVNRR